MNNIHHSNRNITFVVLLIGTVVASLLQTALTTALPNIMQEFEISSTTGQWLTSGFSLAMGIMIPATAFLIKRIPTKKLFMASMLLFAAGSLLSALAPSFTLLLFGRIIQALGTGVLLSLTQVVILTIYPVAQQGKMMGIYGLAASAAPVIAPTITGLLIDYMNWRVVFWFGFLIAVLDLVFASFSVKNILTTEKVKFDLLSFLMISVTFTGILIGFGNLGTATFFSATVGLPLLLAVFSGTTFIHRSFHIKQPLLNLTIFKNRVFTVAVILSVLMYAVLISASTLFPIYVQSVHHQSATISGLIMMPGSLIMAILSPFIGSLYDRVGIRLLAIGGVTLLTISSLLMVNLSASTNLIYLTIVWALRSIALAFVMMPLVTWSVSQLTKHEIPSASALLTTFRTIAGAIGSAIMVAIMSYVSNLNLSQTVTANIHGMNVAFAILTGIALLMLVIAVLGTSKNVTSN